MLETDDPWIPKIVRTMRIIAFALLMGVSSFLVIALILVQGNNGGRGVAPPMPQPLLSYVSVGLLVVMVPLSFVVPALVTRNSARRIASNGWQAPSLGPIPFSEAGKLVLVWQTTQILGLAMLEGASFFGCISYLLEGSVIALVVVALGLGLQLVRFPTEERVRNWLSEQMDRVARLRQAV